jgi:hypothetical protein
VLPTGLAHSPTAVVLHISYKNIEYRFSILYVSFIFDTDRHARTSIFKAAAISVVVLHSSMTKVVLQFGRRTNEEI